MAAPTFKIVFVRHGESQWNVANIFTGWHDVDLSDNGVAEAVEAGKCLKEKGYKFDIVFTSVLRRAIRTAWTVCQHSENYAMPILNNWRLNERHYGGLQGMNKAETAAKHGDDQVKIWRRSFDIPPPPLEHTDPRHPCNDPLYAGVPRGALPGAESLKLTIERVMPLWNDQIAPCVMAGKRVMVAAHGNSLRAICMFLKGMSEKEVLEFNIPTAVPLVYELDANLSYVKDYYLMDEAEVAAKIAAVANQGKAGGGGASKAMGADSGGSAIDKLLARTGGGKPSICICGGGNASHTYMALFSSRGYDVNVFADFGDEAEKLTKAKNESGGLTISDRTDPNNIKDIVGKVNLISKDPAEIFPKCDVVFISLPSFAFKPILEKMKPHVRDGTVIFYLPGQGGADFIMRKECAGEMAAGKLTFCGVMPMPFNCRIKEYGKLVDLAAFKDAYDLAAFPGKDGAKCGKLLSDILGKPVNVGGNMAALHLLGANPNIHPARVVGLWGDWDGKTPYPENPLFYETWDDKSAELAEGISNERCGIWCEIVKRTGHGKDTDVKQIKEYIFQCYGKQIADPSCTKGVFSTNDGYKGFKCPMKEVEGGWVPDFANRYFTEDFPDSFAIYKGLADLIEYSTPTIDKCFFWAQPYMGKEYITGEVGKAKLNGKDAMSTKAPQAFGFTTLEAFLG